MSRSEHPLCVPRWATPRTLSRQSFGPQIAAVARQLGQPLMPWQQMVADVLGELNDDGVPAYREVIVTVPRQSGKTTLVLAVEVQRAVGWGEPQRIAYSAQSGMDARKKLLDDQVPILEPKKKSLGIQRITRANGAEGIDFVNGSKIIILTSMADAGHGKTIDLGVKDELFADHDDRRDQALVPAMATRRKAQVLTTSTMGTLESLPLNAAVERGRAAVESGRTSGTAYFEWSAPADVDPDDPAAWWACMPALGHTITEEVVRHARNTLSDGEFRRAFLNQLTKSDDRVIPVDAWKAAVSPSASPGWPLVFSLDVTPDRGAAAIAAASPGVAELVEHRPGTAWVVERARALSEKQGSFDWFVDSVGPAGAFISQLEAAGLSVHQPHMVQACGQFFDALMAGTIRLYPNSALDAAAAGAVKRFVGEAWTWSRKNAAVDVSPLMAVTVALHGAARDDIAGDPNVYIV